MERPVCLTMAVQQSELDQRLILYEPAIASCVHAPADAQAAAADRLATRGDASRTFYNIAAEWAAACTPASTLVVVPNARHLLPVEDDTRFTALILDLLA